MQEDKKREVAYRIESERTFEITADHSDRKARARMLAVLRNCLFGKKRYQSLILTSALNNLFNALRVAQVLNSKVPELSMIIKFNPFLIVQVMDNNEAKQISRTKVQIKLTTKPTEEDKQQPGFNPGLPKDKITDPIQDVLPRREFKKNPPKGKDRRQGDNKEYGYRKNKNQSLQDQDDYRRDNDIRDNRRNEGRDRDRNRNRDRDREQGRRTQNKSRGGSKGAGIGQREQRQHNYKKEHILR